MTLKHKTLAQSLWVLLHFLIVLYGAASEHFRHPNEQFAIFFENYRIFTGAGNAYGFFAPNIPNQIVPIAEYKNLLGQDVMNNLGMVRKESDLNLNTLIEVFRQVGAYDLQSRSLAVYILNQQPQANSVEIILNEHLLPSMKEYRLGRRPFLQEFYRSHFTKNLPSEGEGK